MIPSELPTTAKEAKALGLRRYFTGKACKHGHVAERYTDGHCVDCHRVHGVKWYKENPSKARAASRRYMGLPTPTRPEPSFCECCAKPPKPRKWKYSQGRALHLDHDHETGKFRGWLCAECNRHIGGLGDNEASIRRALNYLRRSN